MRINLLWPRWARVVAPLTWREIHRRGWRCWQTVQKAVVLLADRTDYQQIARMRRERPGARARFNSSRFDAGVRWLMIVVASAAVFSVSGTAGAADKWLIALHAAGAADLVSTEVWLHQGPQAAEGNPLVQHRAGRIALKAGYNTFAWWVGKKLEESGHERGAAVVRWTALSVQLSATGWNVNLTLTPGE